MTAATLTALTLVLAAPAASPKVRSGSTESKAPVLKMHAGLDDADVRRLVHEWTVFNAAMATLQDSVPALPHGGASPDDLAQAEAAWVADARIRRTLERAGTDPASFLTLYRNVAEAWWALVETENREQSAAGLRREIDALRKTGSEETRKVAAELERGLKTLEEPGGNAPDLEVVRRHRAELAKIFSPEAAGP